MRLYHTQGDGLKVHRVHEVAEQSPLQAQHVPAHDLVAAAHSSEALAMLDAIPSGHDGTRLHRNGTLTWDREEVNDKMNKNKLTVSHVLLHSGLVELFSK